MAQPVRVNVPVAGHLFEEAFRKALPGHFEKQPDLLFHLTTLLSPRILHQYGVPVYTTTQHEGEFVITFPNSYHGGFNMGFNCAEAVNFAPADWFRFGRPGTERFRNFRKPSVVSHEGLLMKVRTVSDASLLYVCCTFLVCRPGCTSPACRAAQTIPSFASSSSPLGDTIHACGARQVTPSSAALCNAVACSTVHSSQNILSKGFSLWSLHCKATICSSMIGSFVETRLLSWITALRHAFGPSRSYSGSLQRSSNGGASCGPQVQLPCHIRRACTSALTHAVPCQTMLLQCYV